MKNTTKAFVAYLGTIFTGAYFLVVEQKDEFVRKNAAQSLTLGLFWLFICIVARAMPLFGVFMFYAFFLVFTFIWIFSIIKCLNKIYYRLPFISDISEKYVVNLFNLK